MKDFKGWSKDQWTVHALNIHGLFFEHWCRSRVAALPQTELVNVNYPVAFTDGAADVHQSSLDIWAESVRWHVKSSFFIECKKNNPGLVDWVFFQRNWKDTRSEMVVHQIRFPKHPEARLATKPGVVRLGNKLPIYEDARETRGDYSGTKHGNFTKTSNAAITDAAQQVLIAFKDLFAQHCERYSAADRAKEDAPLGIHLFFPCIVTSARLFACEFDPADVDGTTGEIPLGKALLKEIPFAIYEYPLPKLFQYQPADPTEWPLGRTPEEFVRLHILVMHSQDFERWLGPDLLFLSHLSAGVNSTDAKEILRRAALNTQLAGSYEIEAEMTYQDGKAVKTHCKVNGDDYDMTLDSDAAGPRLVALRGEYFISDNNDSHWRRTIPDTALLETIRAPISAMVATPAGQGPPRFEVSGRHEESDGRLIEIKMIDPHPEQNGHVIPTFTIFQPSNGWPLITGYVGATVFLNHVVTIKATYSRFGEVAKPTKPTISSSAGK